MNQREIKTTHLSSRIVELNHVGLFVLGRDHAADGNDRAVVVPLSAYDLHLTVDYNWSYEMRINKKRYYIFVYIFSLSFVLRSSVSLRMI